METPSYRVVIPIGCTIYSRTTHEFGEVLGMKDLDQHNPKIVIQYEGKDMFLTDLEDWWFCVEETRVVVSYDRKLTEQEILVERLKYS